MSKPEEHISYVTSGESGRHSNVILDAEFIRSASPSFFDGQSAEDVRLHAIENLAAAVKGKPLTQHTIAAMVVAAYAAGVADGRTWRHQVMPWTYVAVHYPFLLKP